MTSNNDKILAFEYVIYCLSKWFKEKTGSDPNDFSKLKLFKLHFFVCAVNASEKENDLLETFDNFYALPYGPVESDIYSRLSEMRLYRVDGSGMAYMDCAVTSDNFDLLNLKTKEEIEDSVNNLKKQNDELITYSAIHLVDISHKWTAWKVVYSSALRQGKHSESIPLDFIRKSSKIFI